MSSNIELNKDSRSSFFAACGLPEAPSDDQIKEKIQEFTIIAERYLSIAEKFRQNTAGACRKVDALLTQNNDINLLSLSAWGSRYSLLNNLKYSLLQCCEKSCKIFKIIISGQNINEIKWTNDCLIDHLEKEYQDSFDCCHKATEMWGDANGKVEFLTLRLGKAK